MEEIEILPRDAYLHTVNVSQVPCTIQWWFSTKRKNIDFGLFQRRPQSVIGDDASTTGSIGPSASATSTTGTSKGKRLASPPGVAWQQSESDVRSAGLPRTPAELTAKQRNGQFKLHDRNIVEMMPLKHYESSKSTIKGSWNAVSPGSYVLYFDNSFSKNTSKRLSFCVAVKEVKDGDSKPPVLMSGWLLKKKRKRMQGWANRWFSIQGHWLLYSTTEGGISRAKIDLANAVVSISKEDRAITVDSDEGFMQLRAQSDADFTAWVAALQLTKEQATAGLPSTDAAAAIEGATLAPGIDSLPRDAQASTQQRIDMKHVQRVHASFEDSVEQLQELVNRLQESSRSVIHDQAMRYLRLIKDNEGVLYSLLASMEGASRPALARKDTTGSSIGRPSISLVPSHASWLSGSGSDIFYETNEMVEFTPDTDTAEFLPLVGPTVLSNLERATQSSSSVTPSTNMETPPSRAGMSTMGGDADSMSDSEDEEHGYFGKHASTSDSPQFGRMRRDLIRDPEFIEAFARNHIQAPLSPALEPSAAPDTNEGSESQSLDSLPLVTLEKARLLLGSYEPRTTLPAETCEANVSLISILRKNVGKDLSSISMPLVMNEPINALQSLCEELMYSRLLERADGLDDSFDRLMYVAAFAISTLSSKKYRAERKPFNPLLGETYEMVDSLGGYRFVSEKVSHHPPVMACYADSPFYRFWQDSSGKSKFWGKSMEIIQTSN
ncbi:Oxysterol-binding protein 3, partial [Coemansia aciculifera]